MMTRRRRGNCAVYDKNYRFEHRLKPSQNMKTFKTLTLKFSCETVRPLWKYEVKEIDGKTSLRFSFLHISRPLKRTAIVAAAVVWRSAAQWMSRRPRCAFPPGSRSLPARPHLRLGLGCGGGHNFGRSECRRLHCRSCAMPLRCCLAIPENEPRRTPTTRVMSTREEGRGWAALRILGIRLGLLTGVTRSSSLWCQRNLLQGERTNAGGHESAIFRGNSLSLALSLQN